MRSKTPLLVFAAASAFAAAFVSASVAAPSLAAETASVRADGNARLASVDGAAFNGSACELSPGMHGVAVEYRKGDTYAWSYVYCRVKAGDHYHLRAVAPTDDRVRFSMRNAAGEIQPLWSAQAPQHPAGAIEVALQHPDRSDLLIDARLLPGHN